MPVLVKGADILVIELGVFLGIELGCIISERYPLNKLLLSILFCIKSY